jgi:hypothetical protein
MTQDRKQLETLRVSLARLAQAAELHHMIPGAPEQGAPFETLAACAKIDGGWNSLVAALLAKHLADWAEQRSL